MIKTKVAFLEGRLFSGQSELFANFSDCSDCLDKSRSSKKATFVLIMQTGLYNVFRAGHKELRVPLSVPTTKGLHKDVKILFLVEIT